MMIGTDMTVLVTRTDYTAGNLRHHAAGASDAAVVRRLLALDGCKRADAARLAGMNRQTLRDWVHRYNTDGIDLPWFPWTPRGNL